MRAFHSRRLAIIFVLLTYKNQAIAKSDSLTQNVNPAIALTEGNHRLITLSWPNIVSLLEKHPNLSAQSLHLAADRKGIDVAGAVPNPTIEGNFGQGWERSGGAAHLEWSLAVSIPLGWVAQRGSRIDAAQAEAEQAAARWEVTRREVLLELWNRFWELSHAQVRIVSLAKIEKEVTVLADSVKKKVDQGAVRPVEQLRVEIEFEKVQSELESAHILLQGRQAELTRWLGLPKGYSLAVNANLDVLPVPLDRDAAIAKARAFHPSWSASKANVQVLEAEIRAERMARVPSFSFSGATSSELDRRAYTVGLTVDFPLWNWNSSRIAQAEAKLSAGRKQAEASIQAIEAAVIEAQAACEASAATATRYKNQVLPRAERVVTTLERIYQLGEGNLFEVLDARRTLLDSHISNLNALLHAQTNCGRLDILIGEDPQ